MSKYCESYWAELLPSGVIHLLINCSQREIYFHTFSDTQFIIAGSEEEYDNWGDNDVILNVEKFLPKIEGGIYIRASMKEKTQISFYFIPHYRTDRKNSKELLNSRK